MIFRSLGALAVAGTSLFYASSASAQASAYVCLQNPNYNTAQWVRFERVRNGRVTAAGNFYFRPRQKRQIQVGYGAVRYCWGYTRNAVSTGCRPGYIRYARKGYCTVASGGPKRNYSCFKNSGQYGNWFRIENVRGGRVVSATNFYIGPGQTRRYYVGQGYARWCWSRQRSGIVGGCRAGYIRPVVRGNC